MTLLPSRHPEHCTTCPLATPERIQVVHSILLEGARVLFIGEAPGQEEARTGTPFVGTSGQLLDRIFKDVGIDRASVAIANSVACRPIDVEGKNRAPTIKECKACFPYLDMEIRDLKPSIIVTLGAIPTHMLLPNVGSISKVRGRWFKHAAYGCRVFPTFHPSFALRDPSAYAHLQEDLSKLAAFLKRGETPAAVTPVEHCVIEKREQFDWWINELLTQEEWALDTETTGLDFLGDELFVMTTSWEENTAVLLDFRSVFVQENSAYVWERVKAALAGPARKILHNGTFDAKFFMHRGMEMQNFYADTIMMHHLLNENTTHGLEVLAREYTDRAEYEQELEQWTMEHKIKDYSKVPNEILYPYALLDADVTFRSYKKMMPQIREQQLDYLFFNITMPALRMLLEVEMNGVFIDREHLQKMREDYADRLYKLSVLIANDPHVVQYETEKQTVLTQGLFERYNGSKILRNRYPTFEAYRQSKKPKDATFEFNGNSTLQLRELFIDRLGLPVIKKTKNKKKKTDNPSIDEEVLRKYAQTHDLPLCGYLADQRKLDHVRGIFIDGFEPHIKDTGKIHTHYLLFGTVTGRPSSHQPNLNNIPRDATASGIKDLFLPDPGQWMMEVDGAQAEFRMWINYSGDEQAMRDLANGLDIHKMVCALSKGVKIPRRDITKEEFAEFTKDVTKEERQDTKPVVFGLMYGLAAETLADQQNIPVAQARAIVAAFFGRYPKARRWLWQTVAQARARGYVLDLFGRRRRLPGVNAVEPGLRASAERMAMNSPIQGGSSDVVLFAGARIFQQLKERQLPARMLLTVYDSLVYSVAESALEQVAVLASQEMKRPIIEAIKVNLEAEVKIGRSWGKLKEVNMRKPWAEEFARVCQELGEVRKWYYHPESECYLTMFERDFGVNPEDGLLVELGPATTTDEAEARGLHERMGA